MKTKILLISFLGAIFFSLAATAATPDLSVMGPVSDALKAASADKLLPMATKWLGIFIFLQFFLTQLGLLKSGADIQLVIAKVIGSALWAGFCVYVLENGPDFINGVGQDILSGFGSGIGIGAVLTSTIALAGSIFGMMIPLEKLSAGVGQLLLVMGIGVFFSGMYLIVKLFMLQLELGLIVMLSPLSFSFLGMDALKDQGIAPFKSIISLIYRIILIGIISAAFVTVFHVAFVDLKAFSVWSPWQAAKTLIGILAAFPILVFLLFKSDSIAASLAGGHTSMSAADVGGAAAANAAAALPPGPMNEVGGASIARAVMDAGGTAHQALMAASSAGVASAPGSIDSQAAAALAGRTGAKAAMSGGNATDAGIGGAVAGGSGGADLQKTLDGLLNHMTAPPKPAGFGQSLKDLNQHVAQEKAATHVSISTHSAD